MGVTAAVDTNGFPLCVRPKQYGIGAYQAAILVVALGIYLGGIRLHLIPDNWPMAVVLLVAAEALGRIAHWLACGRSQRQLRRLVKSSHGRVCLKCGYCLSGLPLLGLCPECGIEYDINQNETIWQKWLSVSSDYA